MIIIIFYALNKRLFKEFQEEEEKIFFRPIWRAALTDRRWVGGTYGLEEVSLNSR